MVCCCGVLVLVVGCDWVTKGERIRVYEESEEKKSKGRKRTVRKEEEFVVIFGQVCGLIWGGLLVGLWVGWICW